uniref:TMEM205-like domain-containing protein n=1 Tax=Dromaius novaehollandiae TaxID=8790 RepID=A0A8C4K124_DRONO
MEKGLLHLLFLSTSWGMQVWATFVSGRCLRHLPRHTYGFIQSELFPYYLHIGSACAFFNLTIFAMYHPSELLSEEEMTQVPLQLEEAPGFGSALCIKGAGETLNPLNAHGLRHMHRIERSYGLGQEIGFFTSKSYQKLRDSDPAYRKMSRQLVLYHALSSLCNLCCIACNGWSLRYLAAHLSAL